MRVKEIMLGGQRYYLLFNGAAMFEVNDRFGGANEMLEAMGRPGREGLDHLCAALAILAGQGELARRALGYDRGPIPDVETLAALIMPADVSGLFPAVMSAVLAGFGREVDSGEDVDEGLLELEQKKTRS